ncbi:DUF6567 family protein [Reichenbachiella sp. MALMAid0571]|uniref:DUF6567 family protein n=1 Tax=Reichenbachiella sp. MALMAid0571 TaxID=3143939 RepID=UPI0032DF4CF8
MKKLSYSLIAIAFVVFLNSCGVSGAYMLNQNQNTTQVTLSTSNYKVLERVSGSSEVEYVLIFGGVKKRQLYANAYKEMVDAANLESGSKALVNLVTEEHVGGAFPFYYKRTITVSANVVEFE